MPPEPAFPAIRAGQRCRCLDRLSDLYPEVTALRPVEPAGPAARLWVVANGDAELVCQERNLVPLEAESR